MVKQISSFLKNKLASFQFWRAKKSLVQDTDFQIVFSDSSDFDIEILTGKYAGVLYSLVMPTMRDAADGGLEFQFSVFVVSDSRKNGDDWNWANDNEFHKLTGDIARVILSNAVKSYDDNVVIEEKKIDPKVDYEDRKTDTAELDQEREFHEESSTLLEKRVSKRKSRKKAAPRDTELRPDVQQPAKRKRTKSSTPRKKKPNGK